MPREHRKRGRRAEQKKRKLEEEQEETHNEAADADEEPETKRQKHHDDVAHTGDGDELLAESIDMVPSKPEMPFYGMLVEEEHNYFRQAEERLELNDFTDPEDRSLFLASVYREAQGKELRMACSQSSSRLLERLIHLSTAAQLKQLFVALTEQ